MRALAQEQAPGDASTGGRMETNMMAKVAIDALGKSVLRTEEARRALWAMWFERKEEERRVKDDLFNCYASYAEPGIDDTGYYETGHGDPEKFERELEVVRASLSYLEDLLRAYICQWYQLDPADGRDRLNGWTPRAPYDATAFEHRVRDAVAVERSRLADYAGDDETSAGMSYIDIMIDVADIVKDARASVPDWYPWVLDTDNNPDDYDELEAYRAQAEHPYYGCSSEYVRMFDFVSACADRYARRTTPTRVSA